MLHNIVQHLAAESMQLQRRLCLCLRRIFCQRWWLQQLPTHFHPDSLAAVLQLFHLLSQLLRLSWRQLAVKPGLQLRLCGGQAHAGLDGGCNTDDCAAAGPPIQPKPAQLPPWEVHRPNA